MKTNPVFEKHRRQTMISEIFAHERSLIREACAHAVARASHGQIAAIQARFREEEERAFAWCAWLLNQIEKEFGGGLGHLDLDEPSPPCAPRSRCLWASALRDDIRTMKGDPLMRLLIAFVTGFMITRLTGAHSDENQHERDAFERELRYRLRLADEEAEKEESVRTRRRVGKTSKPV